MQNLSIGMNWTLISLLIMLGAYLIGSINTSIIVGRLKSDIDIREHGSGNAGMTNTMRTMGKLAGVLVLLGDVLKAAIVMTLVRVIFRDTPEYIYQYLYIAGIGAVLGHNFPIYFKFKGGKGILVSIVAIFFVSPIVGACMLAFGLLIILISKYVSLGSILGAISSLVFAFIFERGDMMLMAFLLILTALTLKMHSSNIVRLINGEENKIGKKKTEQQSAETLSVDKE